MFHTPLTPEQVDQVYISVPAAAAALGLAGANNAIHTLRRMGLDVVRIIGKPALLRSQVELKVMEQCTHEPA